MSFSFVFACFSGETKRFQAFLPRNRGKRSVSPPISCSLPPFPPFPVVFPVFCQRSGKLPKKTGRILSICQNPKTIPRRPAAHGGVAAGQQDSAAQRQGPRRIPYEKILRGSSFPSTPLALCEVCLIAGKMLQNHSKIRAISVILLKNIFMV